MPVIVATAMSSRSKRRRHKERFHRRTPPGAPPGVLVSDPTAPKPVVTAIAISASDHQEIAIDDLSAIPPLLARWPMLWINVDGVGDAVEVDVRPPVRAKTSMP